jgi:hypothetical protein
VLVHDRGMQARMIEGHDGSTGEGTLRLALELIPGREPIEGSLQGSGWSRAFAGWLELITAIESALEAVVAPTPDGGADAPLGEEE